MSTLVVVKVVCNWPGRTPCPHRFESYRKPEQARHDAGKTASWLRIDGLDFCGEVHAELLRGKHIRRFSTPGVPGRFLPSCSCGWVATSQTLHPAVHVDGEAVFTSRRAVPQVWLEGHILVDLAGERPRWTAGEVQAARVAAQLNRTLSFLEGETL